MLLCYITNNDKPLIYIFVNIYTPSNINNYNNQLKPIVYQFGVEFHIWEALVSWDIKVCCLQNDPKQCCDIICSVVLIVQANKQNNEDKELETTLQRRI